MLKPLPLVFLVLIATPIAAQTPTATGTPAAAPGKDPNRLICEKEEVIGSRLGAKKVCKTWLEWQQERQEQRNSLEKAQQNTGIMKSG